MFPFRSGDEAHIGPTATYDTAICPGFPTWYHNNTDTRIQHLIQSAYNCLKYITSGEETCLSTDYNQMSSGKGKTHHSRNHTGPGSPPGSASLLVVQSPRTRTEEGSSSSSEVQDCLHNVRKR